MESKRNHGEPTESAGRKGHALRRSLWVVAIVVNTLAACNDKDCGGKPFRPTSLPAPPIGPVGPDWIHRGSGYYGVTAAPGTTVSACFLGGQNPACPADVTPYKKFIESSLTSNLCPSTPMGTTYTLDTKMAVKVVTTESIQQYVAFGMSRNNPDGSKTTKYAIYFLSYGIFVSPWLAAGDSPEFGCP